MPELIPHLKVGIRLVQSVLRYLISLRLKAANLKFESVRLNWTDLEDWQRLDELFWLLSVDGAGLQVPRCTFEEQTVCETTCEIATFGLTVRVSK